jgi:ribosomal protein S18 acetylase RimI-like enzyme
VIRQVRGEEDVERRVAVHCDAFAPSRMTSAKHRAVMGAATYRPEFDLVVVAPDESFAAFCIVWFDEVNRLGVFEPVGTHSAHRRRGLGTAILTEGMRRLHALGATTAFVASLATAEPANRLYDSVGLTVVDHCRGWTKAL